MKGEDMKYEINFILRARMATLIEADSLEEAENKLYARDVLDIVKTDVLEESDCDIISITKRKD